MARFTEIGLLWTGKKSVASGMVSTACPVVLEPGTRLVITKIETDKGGKNAPDFRLQVAQGDDEKPDEGKGGGFS